MIKIKAQKINLKQRRFFKEIYSVGEVTQLTFKAD